MESGVCVSTSIDGGAAVSVMPSRCCADGDGVAADSGDGVAVAAVAGAGASV